jgi:hypothetical protein
MSPSEWAQSEGFYLPDCVTPYPKEQLPFIRAMRGEVLDNLEIFIRHAQKPEGVWVDACIRPLLDAAGIIKGGITVFRNVSRRKRTELALRDALQRLSFHVENSPLAVIEWNHDLRVTRWSQAAETIFGWSPNQVLGSHLNSWQFIHADEAEAVNGVMMRLVNGSEQRNVSSNRNYRADGSIAHCEWYNSALLDESGNLVSVLCLILDVTERQRIQLALRQSEERYRSLVTASAQWVWNASPSGEALTAPVNWQALTSQSEAEWIGWGWLNSLHPDDRERTAELWTTAVRTKSLYETEYRVRAEDGSYRDFYVRGVPVIEADGRLREWVGTCTDITQRKRAEETLLRISKAVESTSDAIGMTDMSGCSIYHNQAFINLCGYTVEELNAAGGPLVTYAQPEVGQQVFSVIQNDQSWNGEVELKTKSGQIVPTLLRADCIVDDLGKPVGLIAVLTDITQRKETESALRESSERFRTSVESMLDCFCIYSAIRDPAGQILDFQIEYVNAAACANNRMTKEEQIGKRLGELFPAHRETGLLTEYIQVVETNQPLSKESLFYEDVYKGQRLLRAYDVRAVKHGDGFAVTWRDITQRKHNEERLQALMSQLQQRTADLAASHSQMQAILDNTPALIYIIGVDGRMQFANAEWYRVFGSVYGNPIVGRYLTEYLTPEHAALFFQENEIMLAQDSVMTFENDVSLPDGVHTFLRTKFSLRDAEGKIYAFCGVSLDITERKQIEIHLRNSEQRLRAIFDNVPLGLYITGSQGCEFANQSWLSLMGLTLESALGTGWMQAIHPEDREWVANEVIAVKNANRRFEAEYRFVDRDGNIYWMLDRAVPIRDHTDQVQFYQGFLLDITERKRAEEVLRASVQELERLNRLKDDFLSTVSHELRTPITNMKMAIHMLKIALNPELRERYLQILQTECTREAQLINDLLDLQRLEATSYPISLEPVNLQDCLPSMLEPFRSRTQECQQTFQVNFSPGVPTLLCNRANLERILAELLNNACKYTPAGGEITLSIRYDPKQPAHVPDSTPITIFSIRNSAEIPATELPRIFEKFYRVSNADRWKQGGTGLGLALVQKLVEQLQGTIEVESGGGWTTFSVQLPNQPNS